MLAILRLGDLLRNPKVKNTAVTGGAYFAGAHGGPYASDAVRAYGPTVVEWLARFLG